LQCHRALNEADDEAALLDAVCRILVAEGGYRRALIRLAVPPGSGGTAEQTVVSAGEDDGRERGAASRLTIPLEAKTETLGVLEILAPGRRSLIRVEVAGLTELAETVAIGLSLVRSRAAARLAEEGLRRTLRDLQTTLGGIIQLSESVVEARDPCTAGHQRRVADLARAIATRMDLPKEKIEGIRIAGAIHDIGKISVPSEILSKPAHLTPLEFDLIKLHPKIGYDLLEPIRFPWQVAEIVHQHHEQVDGSGYPRGLRGEGILMEARVIRVADVVEAMSSHRPYRPAHRFEDVMGEIKRNRAVSYDPTVASACIELFESGRFEFKSPA
jgi:HD-GYP domain-containing protein (c-di-GMP phosphodiesterase class II)